ncbi:MAG: VWA domain-containing protein [Methylotenera sp.]|nr:VWA domain-containing protein [Oligoflexia bacterium]
MNTFQFASPQWLWFLTAVPFIYILIVLEQSQRQKRFEKFANRSVWQKIAPELDWNATLKKSRFWLLGMIFLLLTLARPQWGVQEESVKATGLDIMIALDVSRSMEVEDVVPSRLKKAKHLIRSLADRLQGDRVGVVAFAGGAYLSCPLTTDLDYMLEAVDVLSPRTVTNQGTDIGLALETAAKALERGSVQGSAKEEPKADENAPSKVVILISDGEDNEEKVLEGARRLKESGAQLFVFGVGTEKGGPIPVRDETGQNVGFKRNRSNQVVVSQFKPNALMQLASAAGGRYWNVTPYEAEVEELLQKMGALNRTQFAERKYLIHEERFQIPLAIALLLFLLELSVAARRTFKVTPVPPSATPLVLLLLAAGLLSGTSASAAPIQGYFENEKGLKAFKEGKTEEAQKHFGSAQALDPSLPEFEYNQGVVQMKEGNFEAATEGFGSAARDALKSGDDGMAARSFYNLGSAMTQKKDFRGAAQAYLAGLEAIARSGKETPLTDDIRKNLELLAQEQQKQKKKDQDEKQDQKKDDQKKDEKDKKQESKDQKGDKKEDKKDGKPDPKKDGSGKEKEKDSKDQDKKDQKDKDGKENKPGNESGEVEDPAVSRRKQGFKSDKFSKEDAKRVMAELSQREKALQEKLKRQGSRPPQGLEKDW